MIERITYHICKYIILIVFFLPMVAHSTNEIPIKREELKQKHRFIENKGQIIDQNNKPNPSVLYLLNTPGMNVQLRKGGFSYDLYQISNIEQRILNIEGSRSALRIAGTQPDTAQSIYTFHRIDFDLIGFNPDCEITTSGQSAGYLNYYTTGTPVEGVKFVHSYQTVTFRNIYPKIDLEFFTDPNSVVKYNFVVHPGGKLSSIQIRITDPEIKVSSTGSLFLTTARGTIEESIPQSHYRSGKTEVPVNARFTEISPGVYSFLLDNPVPFYSTLTIDPVPDRLWGTYYGGTNEDNASTSVLDNSGCCYIAGSTSSLNNIATAGAHQVTLNGTGDAFLAKFSPAGIRTWATYYGGMGSEDFHGIALTPDVHLVVSGITSSPNNISTPGSFQPNLGSFGWSDAFLVKFDTSGVRIWGTYYGGTQGENGSGCATDANGNIYLSGTTHSSENISTPGSHQPNPGGGNDLFLVKFTPGGNRVWGTYYGGECSDDASPVNNCAVDGNSWVYICGGTCSLSNISTAGSFQPALGGGGDGLLVQFDTSGVRQWGTYYGGPLNDEISYVKVVNNSRIMIAGGTVSESGIASPGAFQTTYGGGARDGFIGRFYPNGQRHWVTYYGGSNHDFISGGDCDADGNMYFCGYTESLNSITTADGFQPVFGGGLNDGMLVKFDSIGNRIWGTYYGGEAIDNARSFNLFDNNNLFLTGSTSSLTNIATSGTQQPVYGGGIGDSFLVKFSDCPVPGTAAQIIGPGEVCLSSTGIHYSVSGIPGTITYLWAVPLGTVIVSGQNSTAITVDFGAGAVSGLVTVTGINQCGTGASKTMAVQVHSLPVPTITGTQSVCAGETKSYTTETGQTGYVWTFSAGGTFAGGGTVTDDFISITWNNTGIQWVSVNYTDNNGCTAGSATQSDIDVAAVIPVNITITASASTVCSGTSVIFTAAPTNPGLTPTYQWKVNGINSGTNSSTFSYTPLNTDVVTCELTSSLTVCISNNPATSNGITMTVNPNLPVSLTVTATQNPVCSGTTVTFTAHPLNEGTVPSYQWKVNGIGVGANLSTYSYIPLNGDGVTCTVNSNATCAVNNQATSPAVTMTVNPNLLVTVSINPSSNPFCAGNSVTFTATPNNGGTPPSYQWKVNGIGVGPNNQIYSYYPNNGDIVTCVLNSNIACPTGNPATSNSITMVVNANLPAGVSISASPNPFCPGSSVTFTATPTNGGSTPSYQWKVNGINAGTNSSTFSYNPVNNDSVRCIITSNLSCVTGNPASSAKIIMLGTLAPTVIFTSCFDTLTTINAKPFKLKGGIPLGGTYSGPGVNSLTGVFTPLTAGTGTKIITYSYTNISLCSAGKSRNIIVQPEPVFVCGNNLTDIRDNKLYPTVQIGSQCWMAKNLDYGFEISDLFPQTDNCVAEKYIRYSTFVNQYSIFYQWDELMRYDRTAGSQGLCPPGWHVPTENEWQTLFNFYQGNGFAGIPLQDSIISGFNALRTGVFYLNSSWSFPDFATLFWSSTSWDQLKSLSHGMNTYNYSVSLYPSSRANAFPVRCLRD